jgi:hypothetical protein
MKKIIIALSICLFSIYCFSQHVYIKAYGGYGIKVQGLNYTLRTENYYENDDSANLWDGYQAFKISMGKGFKYGITLGKGITKNIALELGAEYNHGKSPDMEVINNYIYDYDYTYQMFVKIVDNIKLEAKMYQITPQIMLKSSSESIIPYITLGGIIGFSSIKEFYNGQLSCNIPGYYPFESMKTDFKYKTNTSLGFLAAMGAEFIIGDNFFVFTELKYENIISTPKQGEYTRYIYDGEDILKTLSKNEKYFEFVDQYCESENNNPNAPSKKLKNQFSFNNFCLLAGIKSSFAFNKKSNK